MCLDPIDADQMPKIHCPNTSTTMTLKALLLIAGYLPSISTLIQQMVPKRLNSPLPMTSLSELGSKTPFAESSSKILQLQSDSSDNCQVKNSCSRFMKIQADTISLPDEPGEYSIVIIPGGAKGAATLSQARSVQSLLKKFEQQNKYVGTICAGSLAIKTANLVPGGQVTSHPSVEKEFGAYKYSEDRVVIEQRVISSRGYNCHTDI